MKKKTDEYLSGCATIALSEQMFNARVTRVGNQSSIMMQGTLRFDYISKCEKVEIVHVFSVTVTVTAEYVDLHENDYSDPTNLVQAWGKRNPSNVFDT